MTFRVVPRGISSTESLLSRHEIAIHYGKYSFIDESLSG